MPIRFDSTLTRFCPLALATTMLSALAVVAFPALSASAELPWSGQGEYRVVVSVAPPARPRANNARADERPAAVELDFAAELKKLGVDRRVDMSSLQVIRHANATGEPLAYAGYAYGQGEFDRPFRWHDGAIPRDFPEFGDAVSRSKGQIVRRNRVRGGYFFNAIGDWKRGQLTWMHSEDSNNESTYAVYFNLLPDGATPSRIPPRAWIGDGLPRCDRQGITTMGADHCRLDLADWNDDGLVDLIVGENYGHLFWWPNLGTPQKPEYRFCRFITNADGQPLDAGIGAAPKVVDWDGDGRQDLLVGAHWNRLLYYRNVGKGSERVFRYMGLVQVDGQPLELPFAPLERGSEGVFKHDYYPVPETVDWDGDGDLDLLLGGYVTGRVFWYEQSGANPDGTPQLTPRGPLEADGKPLNVGHWCAAPCVADLDADGDPDLISGNMPMHVAANEQAQYERTFLQFYKSRGESGQSTKSRRLSRVDFPGEGTFPRDRLATPRVFDWDGDGDLDLVVSARMNLYLFENQGTPAAPKFAMHDRPLQVEWGLAAVPADQFRDWNEDGRPDAINGYSVALNDGAGNPYRWSRHLSVLPRGVSITHWSGIGDDWFWPFLDDFDQDGKPDVLFGDWHGNIWFHQNQSAAPDAKQFDLEGQRLLLSSGKPIKVGPLNKDPEKDFDALQGARTVFTVADFDRDGKRDLIVGDTYGKIRYFRSTAAAGDRPATFAEPIEIGDLKIRGLVDSSDWNEDGWPDVIASAANGRVQVFLNRGAEAKTEDAANPADAASDAERFASGIDPQLPSIIQPRVLMVDLNGDGDKDLYLPSTQGSCFVERSFLENGYAPGRLVKLQQRDK
ncbi:MAG: VCBS repeat-containing protein [Planctomycetales bacterium]|nr:VCBS repeat-containing protein [Planctomycetales bacterium]